MRGPSRRPPSPAPARAAASAILGAPNRNCSRGGRREDAFSLRLQRFERKRRQGRAKKTRGLDEAWLLALGREGKHPPLAWRRARIRQRPARKRRDRLARNAGAAADADRNEPAHGFKSRHCTIGIAARQPE